MPRMYTRVRTLNGGAETNGFSAGVSLHSHTNCSKETLEFLPYYALRMPVVSTLFRSERERYEARTGWKADFNRAYWTPPVSPSMVFDSERAQIEDLDLQAVVSITDHDTVEAGVLLTQTHASTAIPISVEWTVPFDGTHVHVGVHNLPAAQAAPMMQELATYTSDPQESRLPDLLELVDGLPDTLVVLNHPLWDHRRVGAARHTASVQTFLSRYRGWIHALEINGLRPWRENQHVLAMAQHCGVPAVAGGDRHGCQPNPVVNLTRADTWEGYVADIRRHRRSDVLLLPAYWSSPDARNLEAAADALRHYRQHPYGQRRFIDRVFADIEGYGWHPLTFYWSGGVKPWIALVVKCVIALGGPRLQPIMRWALSSPDHSRHEAVVDPAADLAWEVSAAGIHEQQAVE